MKVWRRAAIGLIAGAATAIAAIPAHADPVRTAAASGPRAAKAVVVRAAAPSSPAPAHRHHAMASRAPATANTNSKRTPGHAGAAAVAPAVQLRPAVGFAARPIATTEPAQGVASTTATRAPPARQ